VAPGDGRHARPLSEQRPEAASRQRACRAAGDPDVAFRLTRHGSVTRRSRRVGAHTGIGRCRLGAQGTATQRARLGHGDTLKRRLAPRCGSRLRGRRPSAMPGDDRHGRSRCARHGSRRFGRRGHGRGGRRGGSGARRGSRRRNRSRRRWSRPGGRAGSRWRSRSRSRSRCRRGRRRRCRRLARRQQRQRIDVPLVVDCDADAEMDVRALMLGLAARADGAHHVALVHDRSLCNACRADVRQRDGIAVGGRNRDRQPVCRHRAGERHRAAGRRPDRFRRFRCDVDPTMLSGRVRVGAEDERAQDPAAHRPRPRVSDSGDDECEHECREEQAETVCFLI
jgi:hypothetical protein